MAGDVLAKELQWVLRNEIPILLGSLDVFMAQCENTISRNMTLQPPLEPPRTTVLQSSLHVDYIKGKLTVSGDQITKAEITLKLPSRGGHKTVKTLIREHDALKLEQIQNATNYFAKAFQKHKSCMYRQQDFDSQHVVVKAISEIHLLLLEAVNSLKKPKRQTLADIHGHRIQKILKPSLPEDTLLFMNLNGASLVVTMLLLSHVKGGASKGDDENAITMGNFVESTIEVGNHYREVSSQCQVQAVIPWLQEMIGFIDKAVAICQEIIDKMSVFTGIYFQE